MVRIIEESYTGNNTAYLKIKADNIEELNRAIKAIRSLISSQISPTCERKCENYYTAGCLGGYQAAACHIYGILETLDNPHHDMDCTKCIDYKEKFEGENYDQKK